jgi:hypothetical protein
MAIRHVVPILGLAAALAGCGSVGAIDIFQKRNQAPQVPPSQALLPPVDTSQLPPLDEGTQIAAVPAYGEQPLPQPGATTAEVVPPSTGLGRTDLLGGWTISSGSDSCQLFMTLTSWTGGYRATTRGCNSDFLKSISAWNLSGTQVVLAGTAGAPIAHLKSAGLNRFDGTADAQGTTVTFYR